MAELRDKLAEYELQKPERLREFVVRVEDYKCKCRVESTRTYGLMC